MRRNVTPTERAEIVRLLRETNLSAVAIGARVGWSDNTVCKIAAAEGLKGRLVVSKYEEKRGARTRACSYGGTYANGYPADGCMMPCTRDAPICDEHIPRFDARPKQRATDEEIQIATSGGMSASWAACMAAPFVEVRGLTREVERSQKKERK